MSCESSITNVSREIYIDFSVELLFKKKNQNQLREQKTNKPENVH